MSAIRSSVRAGHIRAGTLKGLAIASGKRHSLLPDVPTSAEAGLPNFQAAPFYAIFAPKGTPQAVIDRLADALDKGARRRGGAQALDRSRRRGHREERIAGRSRSPR